MSSGKACAVGPTEPALARVSFEGDDFGVFGVLGGRRGGGRAGRTVGMRRRLREGICCCTLRTEFWGLRKGVAEPARVVEGYRDWEKDGA